MKINIITTKKSFELDLPPKEINKILSSYRTSNKINLSTIDKDIILNTEQVVYIESEKIVPDENAKLNASIPALTPEQLEEAQLKMSPLKKAFDEKNKFQKELIESQRRK